MEQEAEARMDQTESAPENIEVMETKQKGPKDRGRGRGARGYSRGKMRGRALNGFGPIRRGIGRMRPYPDSRGRRGARGGLLFPPSPPTRGMMRMSFLPPPPPPPPPRRNPTQRRRFYTQTDDFPRFPPCSPAPSDDEVLSLRYGFPLPPLPPPPPPGLMGFRGRPLPPRPRGMLPWPPAHFSPPGGFPNGPRAPGPPPPGRGQRWPGQPGGRLY